MKLTILGESGMRKPDWDPAKGPPSDLSDYNFISEIILTTTPQKQTIAPGPTTERMFIQLYYWSLADPQYAHLFRKLTDKLSNYGFGGQHLLKKLDNYIEHDSKRKQPKLRPRQKSQRSEEDKEVAKTDWLSNWAHGN